MKEEISTSEEVPAGAATAAGVASQDAGAVVKTNTFANVTGDPGYDNMIFKVRNAYEDGQNHVLDMYWIMGDEMQPLLATQDSRNVSAVLKKMTQDVNKASDGLSDLKTDTLRNSLKVREKFDKNQLDLAKAGRISLRNLLHLCKNDVKDEERDVLLKNVSEGKLKQTDIREKVKELHPPEQSDEKRGGARKKAETPLVFMKRIQGEMGELLTDLKENFRLHTATALGSEDLATKTEYTQQFEARAEQFEQLNEQWIANEKVAKAFLDE